MSAKFPRGGGGAGPFLARSLLPILNGEQSGAVEDSKIALNDPGCVARAHPTAALSD